MMERVKIQTFNKIVLIFIYHQKLKNNDKNNNNFHFSIFPTWFIKIKL